MCIFKFYVNLSVISKPQYFIMLLKLVLSILLSPVPITVNMLNNIVETIMNNIVHLTTLFVQQQYIVRSTTIHCSFNNIVCSTTIHYLFNNIVCSITLFVQQHWSAMITMLYQPLFNQQRCNNCSVQKVPGLIPIQGWECFGSWVTGNGLSIFNKHETT